MLRFSIDMIFFVITQIIVVAAAPMLAWYLELMTPSNVMLMLIAAPFTLWGAATIHMFAYDASKAALATMSSIALQQLRQIQLPAIKTITLTRTTGSRSELIRVAVKSH